MFLPFSSYLQQLLPAFTSVLVNKMDPDQAAVRLTANLIRAHSVYSDDKTSLYFIYPYKPSVLFVGHRQRVPTQIICRNTRRLISVFTVCL